MEEGEGQWSSNGSEGNGRLPQSDVGDQSHGMDMDVLPREPPVHGGVNATSVIIPACEQPDCSPSDGAPECSVCREEVEWREMVRRFPACLQVSHQRCR